MSINHPTTFIILGATGDLAEKKLFPALFELFNKKDMALEKFSIIAFARRPFSNEEFRVLISDWIKKSSGNVTVTELDEFLGKVTYVQGQFDSREAYQKLAQEIEKADVAVGACAHKLFHLSISPIFYEAVLQEMNTAGLTISCAQGPGTTRILLEKPIGFNEESSKKINTILEEMFLPEQICRIDHYVMKDGLYSELLHENFIQNARKMKLAQISLLEKLDIQGRGSFYDAVGALRDVGQNHALEALALLAARKPTDPASRAEFLQSLSPVANSEAQIRGQYEGYTNEEGVKAQSTTETYFKVSFQSKLPEYAGAIFIIEGGKSLSSTETHFNFVFTDATSDEQQTKDYALAKTQDELTAYARMYAEAVAGNMTRFVSKEEVLAAWKVTDAVTDALQRAPLTIYPKNWTPKA